MMAKFAHPRTLLAFAALGLGPIRGIHGTARMWFKLSIDGESGDGG